MKYVIVDIDGTISKVGDRIKHLQSDPKDWDSFYERCDEDEPIYPVIDLVRYLSKEYEIIFLSGRKESCRKKTDEWISKYVGINYRCLWLRDDTDHRHDIYGKPEILEEMEYVTGKHFCRENIAFILEDRTSMVKKWRELGYTCLQVADGDF